MSELPAFKAYDIRGKVPEELDEELAYQVGLAYTHVVKPQGQVATGRDIRDSSASIQEALNRGLMDGGVDVVDIGLCGTESIYFAASQEGMGGGVMVTASHNPKGYNGLKPVAKDGAPLMGDYGLDVLKARVLSGNLREAPKKGQLSSRDVSQDYVDHILSIVKPEDLAQVKIVANPGNGCAGPTAKDIFSRLDQDVFWLHDEPDEDFPNGIPNPLILENRKSTSDAVLSENADFGVAWDGDFDRCFFFDSEGHFIEGYYVVGLLAEAALQKEAGATIIHDPRLFWNTQEIVSRLGGRCVQSPTGHSFIKQTMRREDGVYGGEMSAHHYFKDFSYCDSGMLPWLMVLKILKKSGTPLIDMLRDRMKSFPCSGEINFRVQDQKGALDAVLNEFKPKATSEDLQDGVSLEFNNTWRFNLRASNTEPLLRLNIESRGDIPLMQDMTEKLSEILKKG